MGNLRRTVAALSSTAFLVIGASMLVTTPAQAAESLVAGSCGATLKGEAGTPVSLDLASALGISGAPTISLGTAPEGTKTFSVPGSELLTHLGGLPLLGAVIPDVCAVTVTGVKSATEPITDAVGGAGGSLPGPVGDTVDKVTDTVGGLLGNEPEEQPEQGSGSDPKQKPGDTGANSEPLGGTDPGYDNLPLPYTSFTNFSSLPFRYSAFDFDSAPALRYGDYAGYSPDFGMLGQDGSASGGEVIRNAGSADQLPHAKAVGLPVLLAVLMLAGASAGLVRTWVLRRAATVS